MLFGSAGWVALLLGTVSAALAVAWARSRRKARSLTKQLEEHRRLDEALQHSEERFRLFSEAAFEGLVIHEQGRIMDLNSALARMFGYEADEMMGRSIWEFLTPESRQVAEPLVTLQRETTYELAGVRRNGEVFPIEVRVRNLPWRGRNLRVVAVRDITERKRLEEQLREAQKLEAIGRLAGGVAHDFNNLLTIIGGYAELLLERLEPADPRHEAAREILQASQKAAGLARQLLAFGRRQVLQPRVIQLNELVQGTYRLLRRTIGEHIEIELSLSPDAGNVRADPTQIEQVLLNLALNARDAMPNGGRLTIATASVDLHAGTIRAEEPVPEGHYVLLSVTDTGCGMDEATRSRIFEPFFTTKPLGHGAGLGLAVVYGIVRQHGGVIEVESSPGKGTTFRVYLPRVEEPISPLGMVTLDGKPRGSETLLLLEDEEGVRTMTRRALESLGYTVLEAATPSAAQDICQNHPGPIHMLITDVILPEMSGRRLAEMARQWRPGLRVLFLSGYSDGEIERAGVLQAGLNFLAKPFSLESLARKIREVLDAPA